MSYKDNVNFANTDANFRSAVTGAIIKCALDINGELQDQMGDGLWKARSRLALAILQNPASWINAFALACKVFDPTLTGDVGQDVYLVNTCAAVWNDLAYMQAER